MIVNLRQLRLLLIVIPLLLVFIFMYKYTLPEVEENHLVQPEPKELYGEFLTWEEARQYFNKYSSATIMDLDTGLQFNVQRRGGSNHADVQPLTAEDTATMKAIYNGKWSWKRRAVIVEMENGRKIAGSMNGMPHGRGAIAGNNFNGHSCIHFRDSTTHGSRKVDLTHQMMVWKAANVVEKQIKTLGAEDSIRLFFTAIDQGEMKIAGSLLDGEEKAAILELFRDYDYIRVSDIIKLSDNNYKVNVLLAYDGGRKQLRKDILLRLTKKKSYWHIDVGSIVVLLQQPGA
ncbi:MAG TPA: hypothetical protein DD791_04885 [Syntrophomonas sp.]|nr:hypothetical protein [Syntrophomonas sp.]